jgi:uncharacterized phiE125 gp8 family phage protein
MKLSLVTAPADPAITLDDVKLDLRIGTDVDEVEDDLLERFISAATGLIDGRDGWLGRALITQEWALILDCFPSCDKINIPLPPLQSVESVVYIDADGEEQTLDEDEYRVVNSTEPGFIEAVNSWPQTKDVAAAVTISFIAGYGDADTDIPETIKQWLRACVGEFYMNREISVLGVSIAQVPHYQNMLENFRVR